MRKYVIAIALAAAFYIDTVLFGVCGSPVFWPNTVLAVIAALSVMGGAAPFAAVGIGIGFIIDVVYNKYIGLTSLSLLLAALAGKEKMLIAIMATKNIFKNLKEFFI